MLKFPKNTFSVPLNVFHWMVFLFSFGQFVCGCIWMDFSILIIF